MELQQVGERMSGQQVRQEGGKVGPGRDAADDAVRPGRPPVRVFLADRDSNQHSQRDRDGVQSHGRGESERDPGEPPKRGSRWSLRRQRLVEQGGAFEVTPATRNM